MKRIIKLTESDIKKIVLKVLNESETDVSGIVHKHVDTFVDETINKFMDIMIKMSEELSTVAGVDVNFNFVEAEMHFEQEMLNLSEEIIHKIHEDEELNKHFPEIENHGEH